jgi:Tfp pilus assembly protein FimT
VVVVGLMAVLAGVAVLTSGLAIDAARADSGVQQVVRQLREARELAIADRRNIQIEFLAPNQIRLTRRDVTGAVETGVTVLRTVTLEGRLRYLLPDGTPDTPDGFGAGGAVAFGNATALIFTSEGSFVDQTGDPLNGTVFLADPAVPLSRRAVTVFGPTALVGTFRWNGTAWAN